MFSQWKRIINPSGEKVLTKTYTRHFPFYSNGGVDMILRRRQLAALLQVPTSDVECDLNVTIVCTRYPAGGKTRQRLLRKLKELRPE